MNNERVGSLTVRRGPACASLRLPLQIEIEAARQSCSIQHRAIDAGQHALVRQRVDELIEWNTMGPVATWTELERAARPLLPAPPDRVPARGRPPCRSPVPDRLAEAREVVCAARRQTLPTACYPIVTGESVVDAGCAIGPSRVRP